MTHWKRVMVSVSAERLYPLPAISYYVAPFGTILGINGNETQQSPFFPQNLDWTFTATYKLCVVSL